MHRRYRFTAKAGGEVAGDRLAEEEVMESILNADRIGKRIRSRALHKGAKREYLYVIKSVSFDGTPIYTKGKLDKDELGETFYVFISAKLDEA